MLTKIDHRTCNQHRNHSRFMLIN
uniref:Uncharacterized protein n=1 Tax=Rhizophora mucronata TaxID=61149 RepID=A0A2P2R3C2_RHIMU